VVNTQFALGSASRLKREAVHRAAQRVLKVGGVKIFNYAVASGQDEQPFGLEATMTGALTRARGVQEIYPEIPCIGIENGLLQHRNIWIDVAFVVLLTPNDSMFVSMTPGIEFPAAFVQEAARRGFANNNVGSVIAERLGGNRRDPHIVLTDGVLSRLEQLIIGVSIVLAQAYRGPHQEGSS
jgi:inosine/xanthosine triphosphatase